MADAPYSPVLPSTNIFHGMRVADNYGNVFEYDSSDDAWIYTGKLKEFEIVSPDNDGLISPDIYRRLELLRQLQQNGFDFSHFKIKTEAGLPYFYYFFSRDNFIKFIPEAQNVLRVEIDRAHLIRYLMGGCCVGPKGLVGLQGEAGVDGITADLEVFYNPESSTSGLFVVDREVNTPIDTPISLRVFNSKNTQIFEALVPIDGSDASFAISDGIEFIESNSSFSFETGVLYASIDFGSSDTQGWRYKARQRGAKGQDGDDGIGFLQIVPELTNDPSLLSTEAIVSARRSGLNDIRTLTRNIPNQICVSNLSSNISEVRQADLHKRSMVAVETTNRECKDIGMFKFNSVVTDDPNDLDTLNVAIPKLDLPNWEPAPGCGQRNRWPNFRFNWWDSTDIEASFRIIPATRPPESCCESPFFMCPNVGDSPCGSTGPFGTTPILQMPSKFTGDCYCDCDNPIEAQLQTGGYTFDIMDTTSNEFISTQFLTVSADSVIDGSADTFVATVRFDRRVRLSVTITPEPSVCGGEKKESESCAYSDSDELSTIATLADVEGNTRTITPAVVETTVFPSAIDFEFEPVLPDSISRAKATFVVNTTRQNYCRGYTVTAVLLIP